VRLHCIYFNRGISRLLFHVHKSWFRWPFKKISEVAPQTSLDIAVGPLSEMLGNHWCTQLSAHEGAGAEGLCFVGFLNMMF